MGRVLAVTLFALVIGASWTLSVRAEEKNAIKEAMGAHKKKLNEKVAGGTATAEELESLVKLYEAMAKADPPKGSKESWKEKTDALVEATKAVAKKEEGATDKYKAAVNCGACHKAHKA